MKNVIYCILFVVLAVSAGAVTNLDYGECQSFNVSDNNNSYVEETVCSAPKLNVVQNIQFAWAGWNQAELLEYHYANAGANVSIDVYNSVPEPACVNNTLVPKLNAIFALQSNQSYFNETLNLTVSCNATVEKLVVNETVQVCSPLNETFDCIIGGENYFNYPLNLLVKCPKKIAFTGELKQGDAYDNEDFGLHLKCGESQLVCPISNLSLNETILSEQLTRIEGTVSGIPSGLNSLQVSQSSLKCATNDSLLWLFFGVLGAFFVAWVLLKNYAGWKGGKEEIITEKPPQAVLYDSLKKEEQFRKAMGKE